MRPENKANCSKAFGPVPAQLAEGADSGKLTFSSAEVLGRNSSRSTPQPDPAWRVRKTTGSQPRNRGSRCRSAIDAEVAGTAAA